MSSNNKVSHLSAEIELLFDNKKLDILKYLGILYQAKENSRQRQLTLEQLLYYYSLLNVEGSDSNAPIIYKYLRDKKKINEIVIYLANLKLVKINGDIFTRTNKLKISISEEGIDAIESWNSESIGMYLKQIGTIVKKYPYGTKNLEFQKLLYEGEF